MDEPGRLIPILREGVNVIRMLFFRALRDDLVSRYPNREPGYAPRLAGAILNELFGTENPEESFVRFVRDNESVIREEMRDLAERQETMRIPLTDALRVQFLCDSQEGTGDETVLARALEYGILIAEREVPLPRNFLTLVRRLGAASGLLIPPSIQEEAGEA